MFIGRDHELEKLERIYKYNGNGLAIVLVGGDKGIGKTTLIEEFCKKKENIFFMATQERARTNLQKFSLMVLNIIMTIAVMHSVSGAKLLNLSGANPKVTAQS